MLSHPCSAISLTPTQLALLFSGMLCRENKTNKAGKDDKVMMIEVRDRQLLNHLMYCYSP